jgi:hypothetical protein
VLRRWPTTYQRIWRKRPPSCGSLDDGEPPEPVSEELQAKHVNATNDNYTTGPEPGERIPDFALTDANSVLRSLTDLTGPNGLLLVFHRSADW